MNLGSWPRQLAETEKVILLDRTGVDGLNHLQLPGEDNCLCGTPFMIGKKYSVRFHGHFTCSECDAIFEGRYWGQSAPPEKC
jgi:hypothetical protein